MKERMYNSTSLLEIKKQRYQNMNTLRVGNKSKDDNKKNLAERSEIAK